MSRDVTRGEAGQLLRRVLLPVVAVGVAADREAQQAGEKLFPNPELRIKMLGLLKAAAWSTGVKRLLEQHPIPGVALYEPFLWTELVVRDRLHVALVRDETRGPTSDRKRERKAQICPITMPLQYPGEPPRRFAVSAVDIAAALDAQRSVKSMSVRPAGGGAHMMWQPIAVDMGAARKLLHSWQARAVPWLDDLVTLAEIATAKTALKAERERADRLEERLASGGQTVATSAPVVLGAGGMSMPENPDTAATNEEEGGASR